MNRETQTAAVVAKLNAIMDELRGNVDQLNAILVPPQPGPGGEKVAS